MVIMIASVQTLEVTSLSLGHCGNTLAAFTLPTISNYFALTSDTDRSEKKKTELHVILLQYMRTWFTGTALFNGIFHCSIAPLFDFFFNKI